MRPDQEMFVERAEEVLCNIEDAVDELSVAVGRQKRSALANVVVFGRSVTNILQKLRSRWDGFDTWYHPYREEMKARPVMRRFYKMRTEVLKEGRHAVDHTATLMSWDDDLMVALGEPPEGATKAILHDDETGKCGWEVRRPDGSSIKVLHEIPSNIEVSRELRFQDPQLEGSVEEAAREYAEFLRAMVSDLRATMEGSDRT